MPSNDMQRHTRLASARADVQGVEFAYETADAVRALGRLLDN